MKLRLYQIDAFTEAIFGGNPAAVCPLEEWLPDECMQRIAQENNLSETAFCVPQSDGSFGLRWFTPANEVALCGHATLATAFALANLEGHSQPELRFQSLSGELRVRVDGANVCLNFPAQPALPCNVPEDLLPALGGSPQLVLGSEDFLVVYETRAEVEALQPDLVRLARVGVHGLRTEDQDLRRGVIVTAPNDSGDSGNPGAAGGDCQVVSRFFAPASGVNEDPVTGSSFTMLIPYWSERLGREEFVGHQISERGGVVHCRNLGERVEISGRAALYLEGWIHLP